MVHVAPQQSLMESTRAAEFISAALVVLSLLIQQAAATPPLPIPKSKVDRPQP